MAACDHIWQCVTIYGYALPYLMVYYHIWQCVAIYGSVLPYMLLWLQVQMLWSLLRKPSRRMSSESWLMGSRYQTLERVSIIRRVSGGSGEMHL